MLLSQILLQDSINEYKRVIGGDERLWSSFDAAQREWLVAMLHEMKPKKDKETHSRAETVALQGQKVAIVKFCANSGLLLDQGRLLTAKEESALDHFCGAVQLLDDLADVIEDHREGRENILLEDAYCWLKGNLYRTGIPARNVSEKTLMIGLAFSGAVIELWKTAASEIEMGLECFENSRDRIKMWFRSLAAECREAAKRTYEATQTASGFQGNLLAEVDHGGGLSCEIESMPLLHVWQKIVGHINSGPKASQ